jgi:HD-GYP domain-containing protein (c-di-GMP phosphodiesterase class II)
MAEFTEFFHQKIQEKAKLFVNQLAILLKTAQIHEPTNIAVEQVLEKFLSSGNPFIESEKGISIEIVGDYIFMNGVRLRYSLDSLINFDYLVREFKRRELGNVLFKEPLDPKEMKKFVYILMGTDPKLNNPFERLDESIAESDISKVRIEKLRKVKEDLEEALDKRKAVKKTYFKAVSLTKGVMGAIKSGEKVNLKKAKRVVESIVDTILNEELSLIGMTTIKDYDEYTYNHSVNVSILSITLGQRMGLSRKALTELGLVALFHDIGKVYVPTDILNKPTNFTDYEWEIIKKHPLWGAKAILELKGLDEVAIRAIIVAFEHHLNYDFSGYPKLSRRFDLDLFGRIVTIADQYDAMTSSRVYSRIPMSPDRALSLMMERSGSYMDPLLLKIFVNMIGVYPSGTLVMLDTKELSLVFEPNPLYMDRPRVILVTDSHGNRVTGGTVDLAEVDKATGKFKRSIVKTLDPNQYNINLAEYFL